jgi:plastocyanin
MPQTPSQKGAPRMSIDGSLPFSGPFTRKTHRFGVLGKLSFVLLAGLVLLPQLSSAQWNATIGAQSRDLGRQGLAFLPNEIWIHAGESITWTMASDEPHTVTFLTAGQVIPAFTAGCPGFSSGSATFDGTTCATTALVFKGDKFTVVFPVAGNFKLICLIHQNMTGTVHVLQTSQSLPHDQAFYNREAEQESMVLVDDDEDALKRKHHHSENGVAVGTGRIIATVGGSDSLSVMRFNDPVITVHAGNMVEWTNEDPITPHTVTFGTEPQDLFSPSANVTIDEDGARHGVLNSPSDSVSSGFLQAAPQDRTGLEQAPLGVTRFRVTFSKPGTYPYICALHDGLGMKGKVIVLP